MSPFLVCDGVSREFEKKHGQVFIALHGISFAVEAGSVLAVVGPSGSGKSTLLALLAGLDRPTLGKVRYAGDDITSWDEAKLCAWRRENVGFVFQSWELLPTLTALENIWAPLLPTEKWSLNIRRHASQLLRRVGLSDKAHDFPAHLSGGEQQRIALARALIAQPRVILADEPTGNIDAQAGDQILELLREQAQQGTTVIIVSHDGTVGAIADHTIRLHAGKMVDQGGGERA